MFIPFLEHRDSYSRSVFSLEEVKKTFFFYCQFPQSTIQALNLSGRVSDMKQIQIDSASLSLETRAYLTHNLAIRRFG
ncbi:MAG: hypothetical protein NT065_00910 [Chlamydiae bacterium]|nr:hypothetical protein [Chlamydiota bacterium]